MRTSVMTLYIQHQRKTSSLSSMQDDPLLFDYNVEQRVNDFVHAALSQANITRTNHIMFTMGTDFKYQYAESWFRQMDKLIHYVNKDGRVNALYSTPSIYTDAKFAANVAWPLKTDDFFPYADKPNSYWTGYFTSRPALKQYVRLMSGYYLAARQLEFFKGRSNLGVTTDSLADALALAQHHDAVTGTEKQHVANDYAKRLSIGYNKAEELVSASLSCLSESGSKKICSSVATNFVQCPLLNITYCPPSEMNFSQGRSLVVLVYNSLGWKREDVLRIPVCSFYFLQHKIFCWFLIAHSHIRPYCKKDTSIYLNLHDMCPINEQDHYHEIAPFRMNLKVPIYGINRL
jgi:alpha-mannosidase